MNEGSDDLFPSDALLLVEGVAAKIAPFLAGLSSHMQGAIIAELTANWLAGHIVVGNPRLSRELRGELFKVHCEAVRELADLEARKQAAEGANIFKCPQCGMVSHNSNDVKHRYCVHCHEFFLR